VYTAIDRRDSEELVREAKQSGDYKLMLRAAQALFLKRAQQRCESIAKVSDLAGLPLTGEQWRIVTQRDFNTFSFILWVIEQRGVIDDLTILTFNMDEASIHAIVKMFDLGIIQRVTIVISASIKFRMPERVTQLRLAHADRVATGCFRVGFVWNHAKIALMATGDDRYVLEGSGNMSSNAEIEQYIFDNSPEVYNFHAGWVEDIFTIGDIRSREVLP
jgi:hypothetical protein